MTEARTARFDITRLLATEVLAKDLGARLIALEACGFLLRKVETYDSRYRALGDAYEWSDDARYPDKFSGYAFRMAVNFIMYALTH